MCKKQFLNQKNHLWMGFNSGGRECNKKYVKVNQKCLPNKFTKNFKVSNRHMNLELLNLRYRREISTELV